MDFLDLRDLYRFHESAEPDKTEEEKRLVNKVIEALSGEGLNHCQVYKILVLTELTLQHRARTATL